VGLDRDTVTTATHPFAAKERPAMTMLNLPLGQNTPDSLVDEPRYDYDEDYESPVNVARWSAKSPLRRARFSRWRD
jgi:hypothetical protein